MVDLEHFEIRDLVHNYFKPAVKFVNDVRNDIKLAVEKPRC